LGFWNLGLKLLTHWDQVFNFKERMPELAEVEYFRKQWNAGLGGTVRAVELHAKTRLFRGVDVAGLRRGLKGARLERSAASGKQMLFCFSGGIWLGIHLGMTGRLEVCGAGHRGRRHDHLVLRQRRVSLVFSDMRQFGRVRFHRGTGIPGWWAGLPPAVLSAGWTVGRLAELLERHGRLPIKAALLLQEGFPGIGNWMADEVLWRARISPRTPAAGLGAAERKCLWRAVRFVCRGSLRTVGRDFSDPPDGWLFHERWTRRGRCPRHGIGLDFEAIGGRTTAWCRRCQGEGH